VAEELDSLLPGVLNTESRETYPRLAQIADAEQPAEKEKRKPQQKKRLDKEKSACYIDISDAIAALSEPQQQIVLSVISGRSSADEIIEATGLGASLVLSQLTMLEIKGFIRRDAANRIVIREK
jgi:predicted Rossmann fold nucleotide-binding protein DprA/Smf involved in DNA uptake